jgi:hypothetical protein
MSSFFVSRVRCSERNSVTTNRWSEDMTQFVVLSGSATDVDMSDQGNSIQADSFRIICTFCLSVALIARTPSVFAIQMHSTNGMPQRSNWCILNSKHSLGLYCATQIWPAIKSFRTVSLFSNRRITGATSLGTHVFIALDTQHCHAV